MSKNQNEFVDEAEVIEIEDEQGTEGTATDVVGVTSKEEEARKKKEERAIEWARMKSNLRSRKVELLALISANGFDEQYCKDLDNCIGNERTSTVKEKKEKRLALRNEFIQMFYDSTEEEAVPQIGRVLKGLDLFMDKGIGKDRANQLCAEAIKKAIEPAQRHWIVAVPNTENPNIMDYQLVAVGAEAPEGWTGFLPDELK